jgi:hypothetical protein
LQLFSNRYIFAILHFQFGGEHKTWMQRITAHMGAARNFVNERGDDPTMQNAGITLKMLRRNIS